MTTAIWPTTLPQNLRVTDHDETPPATILRTEMDAGPAKTRRRFSAMPRPFRGSLIMTREQLAIFDEFFNDTIEGGALAFTWKLPRTATTWDVKITAQPTYRPTAPRAVDASDHWIVNLELETVPGTEATTPGGGPGPGFSVPLHVFNDSEGGNPSGLWGESLADDLASTRDTIAAGSTTNPGGTTDITFSNATRPVMGGNGGLLIDGNDWGGTNGWASSAHSISPTDPM